ncbi:thiamine-phosphate pyrophosphorylase [Corynebacterium terpenotabidum Y-11]|uniref:Thiamine-phosphate synthase n=1 Tax=Corynebacterium terpenotabidum Y-11 TaxID=1200352 RepID=S4XDD2_9CORY|nr:thiamine-phosphate pyrophosphorylase [Corynebacterium terpenotabidum Y-11]
MCTPARTEQGDLREFLHAAYDGGVDIIQLRDRSIDTCDEIAALEVLAAVAADHGKLFAVNDRADIAALVGADVFHIGQTDLTVAQARDLLGPDVIVGLSTHSLDQARAAMEDAALDYFCTGPLWETPTKPGRAATGLSLVTETARMLADAPERWQRDKAWFTIGGVNAQTLPEVVAAGGRRAVVVRALTLAVDPRSAAAELKGQLTQG